MLIFYINFKNEWIIYTSFTSFTSSNEPFPDYKIYSDGSSTNTASGGGGILLKCSHPHPIIVKKKLIGLHPMMSFNDWISCLLSGTLTFRICSSRGFSPSSIWLYVCLFGSQTQQTSTELYLQCFEILKHFSHKLQINIDWIPDNTLEKKMLQMLIWSTVSK